VRGKTREPAHLELIPLGVVQRHDQMEKTLYKILVYTVIDVA